MSTEVAVRTPSVDVLRDSLSECLRLADALKLDLVAPHIDLAIARLDETSGSAISRVENDHGQAPDAQ